MPYFGVDAANLVSLFVESTFFGIYLSTFTSCCRVLLWTEGVMKKKSAMNFTMILAAAVMFIFATMDISIALRHNLDAFVYSAAPPLETFGRISNWANVMKFVDYVCQTVVGEMILIYRCFVVWERNWFVVVIPILLSAAETAVGLAIIYIEATLHADTATPSDLIPFITSMLSLAFATNGLTTSLIVYRIWSVKSLVPRRLSYNSHLSRAIRTMIESGLFYTTTIIILFISYMVSSNAEYPISDSIIQIIGITFNLIIIQTDPSNKSAQVVSGDSLPMPHFSVSIAPKEGVQDSQLGANFGSKTRHDTATDFGPEAKQQDSPTGGEWNV